MIEEFVGIPPSFLPEEGMKEEWGKGVYLKCRVKTLSLTDGMKPDQYRTALRQAQ
jgi:hypothetical protein